MEAAAAAPAQVRFGNLMNDLVRAHLEQTLFERAVAVQREILADGTCIDVTARFEHEARLPLIERDVLLLFDDFAFLFVAEALDETTVDDRLFDDLLAVGKLHLRVQPAVRLDAHERTHLTEAVTAAFLDADDVAVRLLRKLDLDRNAALL